MIFRNIALILLLLSLSFADCIGYQEEFDVRVLDAFQRPVEGAAVQITYDRGTSFGEQYFTTDVRYTDANGKVHYNIINQGTTTREIDCDIDITTTVGGSTLDKTVEAGKHGSIVDVIHDNVYRLTFYVRDHFNAGIENATVTIGDRSNKTNDKGYVRYYFKKGTYSYFASYLEAKESGGVEVIDDDVDFQVIFPYYKVTIDVMDDQGTPLEALITMYNETFVLENGHFENNRSFGREIGYEVDYKGLVESGTIITELDPTASVVFDIHAPTISKVESVASGEITKLVITVTDPGQYASGVDVSSIAVSYRLEPADPTTPWNKAVVFPSGFNKFTAQFSDLPADSIVQFTVELKDKSGNRAELDGKFSTLDVQVVDNDTENQTKPQDGGEEPQETPFLLIFGGIFLVILIIYLGIRIKSQGTGGM